MEQYNPIKIEAKWREKWLKENRWQADIKGAKKPYYNLMMFPYPSAEGLHIGNLYAFTGSDIHGRYKRMQGYEVFEPFGFDAFGIHSENFAIKQGVHPRELIKKSTDNFRRQLEHAGQMYSWDNLVDTTDSAYYKWTQWLFTRLLKEGKAYHKEAPVQWCPGCQTVLANEQVIQGKCERCDSVVETRKLRQWFFKITDYTERLLDNLEKIDWSERTKIAQKNWIGRSEGALVKFPLSNIEGQEDGKHAVHVFTTRPDTLFGATFVVVSPELAHEWLDVGWRATDEVKKYIDKALKARSLQAENQNTEKEGVDSGIFALNPASGEKVPVWISDYVLAEYGTGAIMAVPAHDERDFEFAVKYNLPIRPVILPPDSETGEKTEGAYMGEGTLVNSGKFDGMESAKAKEKIAKEVGGEMQVQYHLRDWLISRQRYWGPPIPVIYCPGECLEKAKKKGKEGINWTISNGEEVAIHPVPESDLPVELPYLEDFRPKGTGKAPLDAAEDFVKTKCPECGGEGRRETDVSDTFLDSSWYFLRYPSVGHDKEPWDKKITKTWLPVDMYIGGQEHAVLHLMYARFITMFLHDQKLIDFEEPFDKFRAHGLLIKEGAKISKSKGNIVNPDDLFEAFGADTVRAYLMFLSPLEQGGDWRDEGIRGVHRFLGRVWGLAQKAEVANFKSSTPNNPALERARHQTIKKVTEDIERLHYNTAIATLMTYVNTLYATEHSKEEVKLLLTLLAPFAPYITEELWQQLHGSNKLSTNNYLLSTGSSVHDQNWPGFDAELAKEDLLTIPVQINGKVKAELEVERDTSEKELEKLALENEKVKEVLGEDKPKKIIAIKNKIVNIVV